MAFLAIDGKWCRMMESARQELQGRREYMSNDKIKSWGNRSNGIEAAAHSLIIHGFTWDFEYYQPTVLPRQRHTQHGMMTALRQRTMIMNLLTNVSQGHSRLECNVEGSLRHDTRRDGPHR